MKSIFQALQLVNKMDYTVDMDGVTVVSCKALTVSVSFCNQHKHKLNLFKNQFNSSQLSAWSRKWSYSGALIKVMHFLKISFRLFPCTIATMTGISVDTAGWLL